jgi:hypothetical protein
MPVFIRSVFLQGNAPRKVSCTRVCRGGVDEERLCKLCIGTRPSCTCSRNGLLSFVRTNIVDIMYGHEYDSVPCVALVFMGAGALHPCLGTRPATPLSTCYRLFCSFDTPHWHTGLSVARSAVPVTDRDPVAWLMSPQLHALDPEIPSFPLSTTTEVSATWAASARRFQQAVACVQQLWKCDADGVHADVSRCEVQAMRNVSEHLLCQLRLQHRALHSAVGTCTALQALRDALKSSTMHAATTVATGSAAHQHRHARCGLRVACLLL